MTEERDTTAEMRVEQVGRVPSKFRLTWKTLLLALGALVLLLSFTRFVTGAVDLTSAGAINATVALAVPIGLAGLGGLWAERAGVVNIGLEGQMILGTWFGAWGGIEYGVWGGVIAGLVGGALGGLLHAVATVSFGVDHIVSGVAINILAFGVARYLSYLAWFGKPGGGGATQSPTVGDLPRLSVPGANSLQGLEEEQWFLISDLAGVTRGVLTGMSALTLIAILLVPATYYVLWRTPFGLRIRSVGEDPKAAESLGVNVYRYKYYGVVISGGLAGLGGVFLSMVAASIYREGQTGGRGFIGLAAMIFGNWRPGGLAAGAGLFGYVDAAQLRGGSASVHALLLFLAVGLVALGVFQVLRGHRVVGGASMGIAAVLALLFALTRELPVE